MLNDQVASAVRRYVDTYPEEKAGLAPLLELAAQPHSVTARTMMPGHVTCGVIAVNVAHQVLQIRHRILGRWLLPGGHVESEDLTLLAAATRELTEETGIPAWSVQPLFVLPVDIDVHEIPENPMRAEPAHLHYDFRFILAVQNPLGPAPVALQLDEVTDHRWLPAADLGGRLGRKVGGLLDVR